METRNYLTAADVQKELRISQASAYRVIRQLNEELEKKGYLTVRGKVSRRYFEERFLL